MNIDHPTLFDDILGTPVPTLHRARAESARHAATPEPAPVGAALTLF